MRKHSERKKGNTMKHVGKMLRVLLGVGLVLLLNFVPVDYGRAATITLDFDSVPAPSGACVPADSYLAGFGISLSGVTPGTTVGVVDTTVSRATIAPSLPNVLTQCGLNGRVTYTLNFSEPLDRMSFTRPLLLTGLQPEWRAFAINVLGQALATVGEPFGFSNVPARTFTLTGPGITSVRFDSNGFNRAAFSAVLIDNLTLVSATTLIPYGDRGYKFSIVSFGEAMGFEQPGFDDSRFSIGDAGFGTPFGGCPLNNPRDVKTNWPLNTDILLRKQFNLPPGATNLRVSVAIDNDVQVFINGLDISGLVRHEGCATRDSFIFTAPNGILRSGTNLLAVRGRDRGVLSFLDVRVTADVPPLVVVQIDIKPGSFPNSINLASRGVVPVAILTTRDFNAATVNVNTVRFAGAMPLRSAQEDVDGDGDLDLVLHFDTELLALSLSCGSTQATLTGNTTSGASIQGTDSVRIVRDKAGQICP